MVKIVQPVPYGATRKLVAILANPGSAKRIAGASCSRRNSVWVSLATMFAAGVPLVEALDSVGGASGNFQLNVYKPVMAANLLRSARLLADACDSFREFAVEGLQAANAAGQVLQAWKAGPETLALRRQLEGADYDVVHCRDAEAEVRITPAGRVAVHIGNVDVGQGSHVLVDSPALLVAEVAQQRGPVGACQQRRQFVVDEFGCLLGWNQCAAGLHHRGGARHGLLVAGHEEGAGEQEACRADFSANEAGW